jgi:hypothetical protein
MPKGDGEREMLVEGPKMLGRLGICTRVKRWDLTVKSIATDDGLSVAIVAFPRMLSKCRR